MSARTETWKKLLEGLPVGTQYFTYAAPEEFFYWSVKNPWGSKDFSSRGVHCEEISFSGNAKSDVNKVKYSVQTPREFKCCNAKIHSGSENTQTTVRVSGNVRIDSSSHIKEVFSELSKEYGIGLWLIRGFELLNIKTGVRLRYYRFNPNGSGTRLYLERVGDRLFPVVPLSEFNRNLAQFKEELTKCVTTKLRGIASSCAVEYPQKIKNPRTKLRHSLKLK